MYTYTLGIYAKGDTTPELSFPSWIFSGVLCAGLALTVLASVLKAIVRGYCLFTGKNYETHKDVLNQIISGKGGNPS